jgi:hypothetical protein
MSLSHSPQLASSGLVLNLDAGNARSLSDVSANLLTFPEDFSNAVWIKQSGNSVISNTTIAPDGTLTADTLIRAAATAEDYQNFQCLIGTMYTFSVWLRSNETLTARVKLGRTSSNPQVSTVCPLTTTWQRFNVTWTADITGVGFANIDTTSAGSIQVWGAQLELGSTLTPYYPVSRPVTTTWNDLSGSGNNATLLPNALSSVEVLVVAGGGAGGCGEGNLNGDGGAGGGGGGVIYNSNFLVTSGTTYTVTVGDGGAGNAVSGVPGATGNNSIFGSLVAFGGGGGGGGDYTGSSMPGGSGGGASREGGTNKSGGISLGQGFTGGAALDVRRGAAGGGGAGGAGLNTIDTGAGGIGPGSNGGPGAAYNISGTVSYYGGGGGGAPSLNFSSGTSYGGFGGLGGGASILPNGGPGATSQPGSSGTANTGGGGAGGYGISGGNGGSGIVIVRYLGVQKASGGTITYDGTYTTHTFTATGTTTFQLYASVSPAYGSINNGALVFNGSTTYASIPFSPQSMNFSKGQSICMWIKPTTGFTSARRNPYNQAYGGPGTLTLEPARTINYFFGTNGGNNTPYVGRNSGFTIADNELTFITVTRDQNTNICNWYKNGELITTSDAGGYTETNNGSSPILIGSGYTNMFLGNIYNTLVYNRALTAAEVRQNFNALKGRYGL